MGKIGIIIVGALAISVILLGCGSQVTNKVVDTRSNNVSSTQKPSNLPVPDQSIKSNANNTNSDTENVDNSFKKNIVLLDLTRNEIIKKLGSNYEVGTTSTEQAHILLTSYYFKDLAISFVFGVDKGDTKPNYIEDNQSKINIKGTTSGMTFKQIQEKLGKTEVNETWVANEDMKAYEIHYTIDNYIVEFLSNYDDGRASSLIIYKK